MESCLQQTFEALYGRKMDSGLILLMLTHLPPVQNGRHFAADIFICIVMNETFYILIKISLVCSWGSNDNNPALDNGLVSNRQQAIIWTNVHPIYWWIYAALGGDELNMIIHRSFISITHFLSAKDWWGFMVSASIFSHR